MSGVLEEGRVRGLPQPHGPLSSDLAACGNHSHQEESLDSDLERFSIRWKRFLSPCLLSPSPVHTFTKMAAVIHRIQQQGETFYFWQFHCPSFAHARGRPPVIEGSCHLQRTNWTPRRMSGRQNRVAHQTTQIPPLMNWPDNLHPG